mmetsp:Transcript_7272/g.12508  ORF Transcript_7272/g.12508 Transcript_7272/m.12508 type:complete len:277 (-) Transcript_7272:460-1290(-)
MPQQTCAQTILVFHIGHLNGKHLCGLQILQKLVHQPMGSGNRHLIVVRHLFVLFTILTITGSPGSRFAFGPGHPSISNIHCRSGLAVPSRTFQAATWPQGLGVVHASHQFQGSLTTIVDICRTAILEMICHFLLFLLSNFYAHVVCFQLIIIIMVVLDSTLTFLLGYDTIGSGCIAAMDLNDLSTCFPSHLLSGSCAIRVGPKAVHPKHAPVLPGRQPFLKESRLCCLRIASHSILPKCDEVIRNAIGFWIFHPPLELPLESLSLIVVFWHDRLLS